MGTSLVVHTQIKELAKVGNRSLNISADFYTELNKEVESLIQEACKRAVANGRTTIMGKDV